MKYKWLKDVPYYNKGDEVKVIICKVESSSMIDFGSPELWVTESQLKELIQEVWIEEVKLLEGYSAYSNRTESFTNIKPTIEQAIQWGKEILGEDAKFKVLQVKEIEI